MYVKAIIRFTVDQEAKALPILLRHSPGAVLPMRTYVVADEVLSLLRKAEVRFTQLSREAVAPGLEEVTGERV